MRARTRRTRGASNVNAAPLESSRLRVLPAKRIPEEEGDFSIYGLRAEVTRYIELNGESSIAGTALKKWVNWDSGTDARAYASRMRQRGSWGGALEMAVVAQMKDVVIHVYEKQPRQAGSFKRIATFGDAGRSDESAAHVLYGGRVHYDALEIFH